MKLFHAATSPFVRKVMVTAIVGGVDRLITIIPNDNREALVAANPLGKVPCLVTDDGVPMYDSPVICEYLDALGSGGLFPSGAARWRALTLQALADGMMDAAVARRGEQSRPAEQARTTLMERYQAAISRSLAVLEADVPALHLDIGTVAVACALGYLDFRFAAEPWRPGAPKLAAWFATMAARPELVATAPP